MDKCADLLPDYFSFVKGLVDSADLSLNISRELLQHDNQLKLIARNLEKKIKRAKAALDKENEYYELLKKANDDYTVWEVKNRKEVEDKKKEDKKEEVKEEGTTPCRPQAYL